jgi:hypothetical protein
MRQTATFAFIALALVTAGTASGAATPISPAPGAIIDTSHPVFSWTIPPSEESDGVYIASAPDTTVEGKLFDENVVDLDVFFGNETSWSPSSPLPAGAYWWNVWSHERETFTSFYSAPTSFTIPARVQIRSIRIKRYTGLNALDVDVRYAANTEEARIAVRLARGSRAAWSKAETDEFVSIGDIDSASFTWFGRGRVPEGAKLRLTVTVTAGDAQATATRNVRAP